MSGAVELGADDRVGGRETAAPTAPIAAGAALSAPCTMEWAPRCPKTNTKTVALTTAPRAGKRVGINKALAQHETAGATGPRIPQ
jgi:hypothetical protein